MNNEAFYDLLTTVELGLFVVFSFGSLLTMTRRAARYSRARLSLPRLLYRDLALLFGLCFPFALIFVARIGDFNVRGNILWALGTGIPAVVAMGLFLYYELRVIGRGPTD